MRDKILESGLLPTVCIALKSVIFFAEDPSASHCPDSKALRFKIC